MDTVYPYLVLLQSSGWGKTRFTFEYCRERNVILLYLNLRQDGSGYPPTSSQGAEILNSLTGPKEMGVVFAKSLVMSALELSKSGNWPDLLRDAAAEHSLDVFNGFWRECVKNARQTAPSYSTPSTKPATKLDPLSTSAAQIAPTQNRALTSPATVSQAASSPTPAASSHQPIKVLLVIDEARTLLDDEKDLTAKDEQTDIPSRLRVFRKALHELRSTLQSQGVMVLLLDTFFKVSNFCPTTQRESSSARHDGRSVLAPFFAMGFDPCQFTQLPPSAPIPEFDLILLYGRPLWRASILSPMSFEDLISFAGRKLLLQTGDKGRLIKNHTDDQIQYNCSCAVVCCLLDLEVQSSLSSTLVASHMVRSC